MYNAAHMLNQTVIHMTKAQANDSNIFKLVGIYCILWYTNFHPNFPMVYLNLHATQPL
jgi:hypothetical protein